MPTAESFVRDGLYIGACREADREFADTGSYAAIHAKVCAYWFMEMYEEAADICLDIATRPRTLRQLRFPVRELSGIVRDLGASHWMAGRRQQAIMAWNEMVDSPRFLKGKRHADHAYGICTRLDPAKPTYIADDWDSIPADADPDFPSDCVSYDSLSAGCRLSGFCCGVTMASELAAYFEQTSPKTPLARCHWGFWLSRIMARSGHLFETIKCLKIAAAPHPDVVLQTEFHIARHDLEIDFGFPNRVSSLLSVAYP